jgi:hypothetical protein
LKFICVIKMINLQHSQPYYDGDVNIWWHVQMERKRGWFIM